MKNLLFFLVLFVLMCHLHGQDIIYHRVNFDAYEMKDKKVTIGSNPKLVKKILNQQFSNLITGQTKNSIGNFASIDLTKAEVAFAGNLIFADASVLTIKANGSISDGFF